jgi:hypothetical protein
VARDSGVDIGLYRDLAVGCAPDGAEAWSEQALLLRGLSVGAPPDTLGPLGQVWHLPPPDPIAMEEDGYGAFGRLLATNMRHAGALRIDHVMGLMRLFVVPAGGDARDGTYMSYKLNDLIGQVALESTRAGCLVVGEDLGTVPPEIGVALAARSVLSYRVLWFEQTQAGFTPPGAWPRVAAACAATHDLPTLAGFWSGGDIAELLALGLLGVEAAAAAMETRQNAKVALLRLLRNTGLIGSETPGGVDGWGGGPTPSAGTPGWRRCGQSGPSDQAAVPIESKFPGKRMFFSEEEPKDFCYSPAERFRPRQRSLGIASREKVFWFFSSEKNCFLVSYRAGDNARAHSPCLSRPVTLPSRATPSSRRSRNASVVSCVALSLSQNNNVALYRPARMARLVYHEKSADRSPAACQMASTVRAVQRAATAVFAGNASRRAARRTACLYGAEISRRASINMRTRRGTR